MDAKAQVWRVLLTGVVVLLLANVTEIASAESYSVAFTWGQFGNLNGQFWSPRGLAVDANGRVYVSEGPTVTRIQVFSSSGAFIRKWGSFGYGPGQFSEDVNVTVDETGVYVGEGTYPRIQKFAHDGSFVSTWGSQGSDDGEFLGTPNAAAAGGYVYVADHGNFRIQKFDSDGQFVSSWPVDSSGPDYAMPGAIASSELGFVVVSVFYVTRDWNYTDVKLRKFDTEGLLLGEWGGLGSGPGLFTMVGNVAIDGLGAIYVTDVLGNRIQKFDSNGAYLTSFGEGALNGPAGLDIDGSGNVYVVSATDHRVVVFSPDEATPAARASLGQVKARFR